MRAPSNATFRLPLSSLRPHLASLDVSVVWRALVALTHRTPSHLPPQTSPKLALAGIGGMKGCSLLHQSHPYRCPSPLLQTVASPIVGDTRTVCDPCFLLLRPEADKEATHLAQEAVSEACDGLQALLRLLEFMQMSSIHGTEAFAHVLGALTADFLTLNALPVLLNAYAFTK